MIHLRNFMMLYHTENPNDDSGEYIKHYKVNKC